nr:AT-rich interactive domain-containing protein 3 [Tanacetum cinerariifolium]
IVLKGISFNDASKVEIKASDDVFVYLRDNLVSSLEGIEILKLVKVLDLSFHELLQASGRDRLNGSLVTELTLPIVFLIETCCLSCTLPVLFLLTAGAALPLSVLRLTLQIGFRFKLRRIALRCMLWFVGLVITGQPEQPHNPWDVSPFKKIVSLPSRIDPHQTAAVVTQHGQLFVRVPFEQQEWCFSFKRLVVEVVLLCSPCS